MSTEINPAVNIEKTEEQKAPSAPKRLKRVKLIVAYDGTNYHGWQVQPNGETIEGVLNRTLSSLLGEKIVVTGASRTDAGVHSMGNVAVFDTKSRIPAEKISYAMNQRLPEDIVIQKSEEVPADFHPRHCDSRKTYEYRILNREFPLPMYRNNTYFCYRIFRNLEYDSTYISELVVRNDIHVICSHLEGKRVCFRQRRYAVRPIVKNIVRCGISIYGNLGAFCIPVLCLCYDAILVACLIIEIVVSGRHRE